MTSDLLGVLGFVLLSLAGLVLVRRVVRIEALREHHDATGACFAVVGGLYGIVLAFVLVSAWERFEEARSMAVQEGTALADLYRHAGGVGDPTQSQLAQETIAYAHAIIDEDWPHMDRGQPSLKSQAIYEKIWQTVLDTRPADAKHVALFQSTLERLDDFADGRRGRLLYARVNLPPLLWGFLLATGAITVAFSFFFGMRVPLAHALMVVALSGTIAVALFLIKEMNTPFAGTVRVPPDGFQQFLDDVGATGRLE